MVREIYFRDSTDPKYKPNMLESKNKIEILLSKIRMILFTNRGEVLGEPDLGMDLEDYIFQFNFDETDLRKRWNAQVARYIPEQTEFAIDMNVQMESDGVQNYIYLFININGERYLGVKI